MKFTTLPPRQTLRSICSTGTISLTGVACIAMLLAACSGGGHDAAGSGGSTQAVPSGAAASTSDSTTHSGPTLVRGRVATVNDTGVTVTTRSGDVHVALMQPVTVYTRAPATLADVRANAFVGVTSVADPDGSQHATEIHVFPEALRGTGEGSYPLQQAAGGSASRSTMTNGNVAAGGNGSAPRMTNGAARLQPGGTITVQYRGGTQTIKVPAGVPVSAIVPVRTRLATGANVVVIATGQPPAALKSSTIFLTDSTRR